MGIDIPVAAVASILMEQEVWEAERVRRSSRVNLLFKLYNAYIHSIVIVMVVVKEMK